MQNLDTINLVKKTDYETNVRKIRNENTAS